MSDEPIELRIGDVVRHRVYGPGKILSKNPSGGLVLWTVDFPGQGKKTIVDLENQILRPGEQAPAPESDEGEDGAASARGGEEARHPASGGVDYEYIRQIVREELAGRDLASVETLLGDRWLGGDLVLKPGKEGIQEKVIPIESFFHKIVMLRDRLRVLEQNINAHKKLDDEDKVHLQQYVTRIYGSLTTFNLLFRYKDDYFRGEKS